MLILDFNPSRNSYAVNQVLDIYLFDLMGKSYGTFYNTKSQRFHKLMNISG